MIRKYAERAKLDAIRKEANKSRDRLSDLRANYPELKNLEVKTAKVFVEFYDRYMTLSGINKRPIFNAGDDAAKNKQLVAQIMKERKKNLEKLNDH